LQAEPVLTIPTQAHLLRLVQESFANIRKHARASQVQLTLAQDEHRLHLTIADNGQGFDASADPPDTRHGLRLMRERAALLGAHLQITSAPHQGTRIAVELSPRFATVSDFEDAG
jgi:two-component system nitrate/nitrite sensor histidine kinase NarX